MLWISSSQESLAYENIDGRLPTALMKPWNHWLGLAKSIHQFPHSWEINTNSDNVESYRSEMKCYTQIESFIKPKNDEKNI